MGARPAPLSAELEKMGVAAWLEMVHTPRLATDATDGAANMLFADHGHDTGIHRLPDGLHHLLVGTGQVLVTRPIEGQNP